MTDEALVDAQNFILPVSVVTRADLSHLVEEIERLVDRSIETGARKKLNLVDGSQLILSPRLMDFFSANEIDPDDNINFDLLIKQLRKLVNKAPVIHLTFSTEADNASRVKIISWLRESVHPQTIVSVGIQPSLLGGVHLRTTNQVFDLSLRKQLEGNRELLIEQVRAIANGD